MHGSSCLLSSSCRMIHHNSNTRIRQRDSSCFFSSSCRMIHHNRRRLFCRYYSCLLSSRMSHLCSNTSPWRERLLFSLEYSVLGPAQSQKLQEEALIALLASCLYGVSFGFPFSKETWLRWQKTHQHIQRRITAIHLSQTFL
jgi:hypothetical protein